MLMMSVFAIAEEQQINKVKHYSLSYSVIEEPVSQYLKACRCFTGSQLYEEIMELPYFVFDVAWCF